MNCTDSNRSSQEEAEREVMATTPPKTNMDTQNDGLEKVTPFKNCNF